MQLIEDVLKTDFLKYISFEYGDEGYIAILKDETGFSILKGYGYSRLEALNDLHHNIV